MNSYDAYENEGRMASLAKSAAAGERADFIRKTYLHLAFAILGFVALESILLMIEPIRQFAVTMMMGSRYSWLIVLLAFMGVSHIANKWAISGGSNGKQYAGLILYVVAEAVIFLPLMIVAIALTTKGQASPIPLANGIIPTAGIITLAMFAGITLIAFTSNKDFSFLGGFLRIGGFVALGIIVAGLLIGFNLGLFFIGFMVLFASGAILYSTSNIIRHYRTDQHVAASLALFAAVALLFWYVIQLLMSLNRR